MPYITRGPMRLARRRGGLGDDGDLTSSFLSGVDPSTLALEIGAALVGAFFLMSWAGGVQKSYKRSRTKKLQTKARKAALKARLAAL